MMCNGDIYGLHSLSLSIESTDGMYPYMGHLQAYVVSLLKNAKEFLIPHHFYCREQIQFLNLILEK
jgi:hypothetical protein